MEFLSKLKHYVKKLIGREETTKVVDTAEKVVDTAKKVKKTTSKKPKGLIKKKTKKKGSK